MSQAHHDAPLHAAAPVADHVIVLNADVIGHGPAELGARLMTGLLGTLAEMSPVPTHLILYNSAVLLAVDGAVHADRLKAIEARGVAILICGTCADFYDSRDAMAAGRVTNMLEILEVMTAAGKVISP
jgi:selenium metabolism protein YedF